MKILKNKKSLTSLATILIALAVIASSTYAWFVVVSKGPEGSVDVGTLNMKTENVFNDVVDAQPGNIYPADLGAGYIKNTGSLNLVTSLSDVNPTITRYLKVDNTKPNSDWKTGPRLFGYIQNPDDMLADAGYAGVEGAVKVKIAIPPTADNIQALTVDNTAFLYNDSSDYDGNWYLALTPGTKLDIAVVVDFKTNAYPENVTDFTDPATCVYIDNTYMGCKVEFESSDWLGVQFDMKDAIASLYGLTPDAAGDVLYADIANSNWDVDTTDPLNPVLTPASHTLKWALNPGSEEVILLG